MIPNIILKDVIKDDLSKSPSISFVKPVAIDAIGENKTIVNTTFPPLGIGKT